MLAAGRNMRVSVDNIDGVPDTVLGLFSTCFCTFFLWMIMMPIFDVTGLNWITSWEGKHAVLYPKAKDGECLDALKAKYLAPAQAYAVMDADSSGDVTESEWRTFVASLNQYLTLHGKPEMRAMPCFQEFDLNLDGSPFKASEFYGVVGSKYHWLDSLDAVALRTALTHKYGSMVTACDNVLDGNRDGKVTLEEFQNGTLTLSMPPSSRNAVRLFQHMDTDSDGHLSMSECHFRVAGFKLRLVNTYGNLTAGCSALDTDRDGVIMEDEFLANVKLLTPPVDDADAKALFTQLANGNAVIHVNPECVADVPDISEAAIAAAAAEAPIAAAAAEANIEPTALMPPSPVRQESEVNTSSAHAESSTTALCKAHMELYLEPNLYASTGLSWPEDDELANEVKPIVKSVLETFMNSTILITSARVAHDLGGSDGAAATVPAKQVNVSFQAMLTDAPRVIDRVERGGNELTSKIVDEVYAAKPPWGSYVTIHEFTAISYFFPESGRLIKQNTGREHGHLESDDGAQAFKVNVQNM